jgi:tRNA 2-thiouridine synthesizing protein A
MRRTNPASMSDLIRWDAELDAIGLLCPLPVLRARKRLLALAPGAVLRVLADDPAARIDIPHFCAEQGHELVHASKPDSSGVSAYLIRRSG